MRLAELGERKAVEIIISLLDRTPHAFPPPGDDVSGWDLGDGLVAVLKTDMLVASTDVPPGMDYYQAARKAVVMCVSDMAAKGVKPLAALVSLGLPPEMSEEALKALSRGLNDAARRYGIFVIGGDTNECPDLVIACFLFGMGLKDKMVLRSGARPGDVLAVTGDFGWTYLGLRALLEGLELPGELEEKALRAVLVPEARLEAGLALAEAGVLTASIDSSDGLAWSLHELSRASGVGLLVEELPLPPEIVRASPKLGIDLFEACFYGGEEYELVMTVKPDRLEEAIELASEAGVKLRPIGRAIKGTGVWFRGPDGSLRPVETRGWEHFRRR